MINPEIKQLFFKLVQIPSPSGKELMVAKFIKNYLSNLGINSTFDKSGLINSSDSGNLIAKIKGINCNQTILFVAHMDTVETGLSVIKPILKGDKIYSNGSTILGADNKGSITALLLALKEISKLKTRPTIFIVFSTREEQGQMGISLIKLNQNIDFAFNLDGAGKQGSFAYKTLGYLPFDLEIIGKQVHSAHEPEKGINALKVSSEIITKLPIGKNKQGHV